MARSQIARLSERAMLERDALQQGWAISHAGRFTQFTHEKSVLVVRWSDRARAQSGKLIVDRQVRAVRHEYVGADASAAEWVRMMLTAVTARKAVA